MPGEILNTEAGSAFVKHGHSSNIQREFDCLDYFARHRDQSRTRLAPGVIARPDDRTLYIEPLIGWTSLHTVFEEQCEQGNSAAIDLGRALARTHAVPLPDFGASREYIPRLVVTPADLASLPGELPRMLSFLHAANDFDAALAEIRSRTYTPCFVHGDAKLDNVLVSPTGEVCLVDWEFGGIGDPAWDLGAAMGDFILRWIVSARVAPATPLHSWLEGATISRDYAAALAASIVDGYRQQSEDTPSADRIAECVGVFLIHRAMAWIELYGRFTAKPMLLCYFGQRFVLRSALALSAFLGRHV
ncbi:phosphotransferase family protein [Rhodococcus koreensis]|jgi:hypothetical protein|uniref:phosphotransferase family protein n=1 Tax=Rhodococcus koreensis TaxID=99653 RepID=UPI001980D581|nr:aminoglycoside phosphotransferase family protein [Rhodococcus koreensis]QSE84949.1 aminoglycoside phosphotransferase family protein [Rhodococcus koreensis]